MAAPSAPSTSSSKGSVGADPPPMWVTSLVEAFAAAQRQFDPSNAREVVAVMDHFPTVLEACAKFAKAVGSRSVDAVELPPAAASQFLELGALLQKSVGPARTGLRGAKRLVQDRIDRYTTGRAKDAAWDVSANKR